MDGVDPGFGTRAMAPAHAATPRKKKMSAMTAPLRIGRPIYAASGIGSSLSVVTGSVKTPPASAATYSPDAAIKPSSITTPSTILSSPIHQLYSLDAHQKFH